MSRLLIVDDEVAILDALQDVLSAEGYEVRTALNGAEGLKQVAQGRPDLVLLDLMMPVMDGHEVLQRLKGGGGHPGHSRHRHERGAGEARGAAGQPVPAQAL